MGPMICLFSGPPADRREHRAVPGSVRGLAWAIADIDRGPDWARRLQRHLDRSGPTSTTTYG